ncbi:ATP synthase F1 subunit epsilon [Alphaproteobacteria bacterium]|jgi:F-type H+-transporting ATPase subunit epsilon|nr:ATP synthase F1 subunit epsilon [Alphaproteobacteria bacterium]
MAETTQLELVTPSKVMVQKAASMVVAPGVEGLFGVLPRHAPLLADLARGVIEVYDNGKVVNRYMIDGGLADVTPEAVTILAERAEDMDAADAGDLKTRAQNAPEAEADFLRAVAAAL